MIFDCFIHLSQRRCYENLFATVGTFNEAFFNVDLVWANYSGVHQFEFFVFFDSFCGDCLLHY